MLKYIFPALNIAISVSWYQVADFQFDMNVHFRDGEYFLHLSIKKLNRVGFFIQDQISVHAIKVMIIICIGKHIEICYYHADIFVSIHIYGVYGRIKEILYFLFSKPRRHPAKHSTLFFDPCR